MNAASPSSAAPQFSLAGVWLGVRLVLPAMPGLIAFGMAFGTVAAQKGFSAVDAMLMSGAVFAGMVQFVALDAWPDQLTSGAILALALLTVTVNMRFMLIGASLRPWLGPLPPARVYPTLFFLTDTGWLAAMRYHQQGGGDAAVLLGGGIAFWIVWVLSCVPGHQLGAAIGDPQRLGLDLVMPVYFAAMLVPLWRGPRRAVGWVVAGIIALTVDRLAGGYWYVLAGAVSGSVVGGLLDERA